MISLCYLRSSFFCKCLVGRGFPVAITRIRSGVGAIFWVMPELGWSAAGVQTSRSAATGAQSRSAIFKFGHCHILLAVDGRSARMSFNVDDAAP